MSTLAFEPETVAVSVGLPNEPSPLALTRSVPSVIVMLPTGPSM